MVIVQYGKWSTQPFDRTKLLPRTDIDQDGWVTKFIKPMEQFLAGLSPQTQSGLHEFGYGQAP